MTVAAHPALYRHCSRCRHRTRSKAAGSERSAAAAQHPRRHADQQHQHMALTALMPCVDCARSQGADAGYAPRSPGAHCCRRSASPPARSSPTSSSRPRTPCATPSCWPRRCARATPSCLWGPQVHAAQTSRCPRVENGCTCARCQQGSNYMRISFKQ